jgi:RNA polymerase primary sigma factor
MPVEDRFQVLALSLHNAAGKYRPDSKAKFVTYAAYSMARDLNRAIHGERYHNEVSDGQAEALHRVRAARRKLRRLTGCNPSNQELEADTGFGRKAVEFRLEEDATLPYYSLEDLAPKVVRIDRDSPDLLGLADMLYDEHAPDPVEIAVLSNQDEEIEKALDALSEREAGVIRLRFGLRNGEITTHEQVGNIYGVSRERIRQLESKTMSKLRDPNRSDRLRPYVEGFANPARRKPKANRITVQSHPHKYDLDRHPWLRGKMNHQEQ